MHDQQRPDDTGTRNPPPYKSGWRLVGLFLLASAWGLSELLGGETVVLVAVALLLLSVGRALLNRFGVSIAMAAVAVLFKSVNAAPFFCHLTGIALLGVGFDIMATLLWRSDRMTYFRGALVGAASSYLGCVLFAASMVWVFEYRFWADGGLGRVAEYTLFPGSRGALTGLVVVPVGLWLGRQLARQAQGHPRTVLATALTVCVALWSIGPFAG